MSANDLKSNWQGLYENFLSAFNGHDMNALSAMYTEDCVVMTTGQPTLKGRDAAKAVFGAIQSSGANTAKLILEEIGGLGDNMAFERGCYVFNKADGTCFDKGKYVGIWKKINGQWLLYTDIFNTDVSSSQS